MKHHYQHQQQWTREICAGVFCLVIGCAVLIKWSASTTANTSFAEVDPVVSIDQSGVKFEQASSRQPKRQLTAGLDGEVARQTERLRDLCDLALVTSDFLVSSIAAGHKPVNVREFLLGLSADPLYTVMKDGRIQSKRSLMLLRYRPEPVALEILSMSQEPKDGPGMLVRLPDTESTIGPRFFQSRTVDNVRYPQPFSEYALILAGDGSSAGWTEEPLRTDRTERGGTAASGEKEALSIVTGGK